MTPDQIKQLTTPTQLRELRAELLIQLNEAEWGVHLINSILEERGCE